MQTASNSMLQLKLEFLFDIYAHTRERRRACESCGIKYEFKSLKALSSKYGLSYSYVRKVSCLEKWRNERRKIITEIHKRTMENVAQKI